MQTTITNWNELADKVLQGDSITKEEGLSILQADDEQVLPLMNAAFKIRQHYYQKKVKLNMILNAKSGLCPEDCGYCSQSINSTAPIEKYTLLEKDELLKGAQKALDMKVGTYCIVASGRGPTPKEVDQVIDAVTEIKDTMPLKICACLGILSDEQAVRLKQAGVDRYNHNINTSKSNYGNITTTHTYDDRVDTVETAKAAGMSPCSGIIVGMGEKDEEIIEMAEGLKALDADSIPVNFLNAIPGTLLEKYNYLTPMKCLKVLALMRFINPSKEIRISGGREVNLRSLQPLGLYAANSIFIGDYLTTEGQQGSKDHQMIEDMGFEIEVCAL
ncbi:biotin synthase BioB [Longirhabdus pacifica]|uniref:biotin synthase BioB n=1 Tax=Longirhabdus pacifica TaxID=2305227 RepID=UPI0010086E21|nr:biotin synthase BioB [Longirhabdus pacifica]